MFLSSCAKGVKFNKRYTKGDVFCQNGLQKERGWTSGQSLSV